MGHCAVFAGVLTQVLQRVAGAVVAYHAAYCRLVGDGDGTVHGAVFTIALGPA